MNIEIETSSSNFENHILMVFFLGNKEDKDFGMTLSSDLTQT
jgi:hypothetical protein